MKNTVVRCDNCHQRIVVEIEDGKTSAMQLHNEKRYKPKTGIELTSNPAFFFDSLKWFYLIFFSIWELF